MFSGIIERVAAVTAADRAESGLSCTIATGFSGLVLGESVAVNGVCLTVAALRDSGAADFFASPETLVRTNLSSLRTGSRVNLERSVSLATRLSGHLVQGHVDGMAKLARIEGGEGSWRLEFDLPQSLARYCVEKGSIALNGVSLTINGLAAIDAATARIAITLIPHTWGHTTFPTLTPGDAVNVEVDVIAKYVERLCQPLIKP